MGLLADVQAVLAAGGVPVGLATVLTAQGRRFRSLRVPRALLAAQLQAALDYCRPGSAKLGVVPDARTLALLWPRLVRLGVPLVVDPVVRTSRGERLSSLRREDYLALAGPRVWLTPNLPELAWLCGRRAVPASLREVGDCAATLCAAGFAGVVVKGGHRAGPPVDVLVQPHRVRHWTGTRLPRPPGLRGTGCRFASTLATHLARGCEAQTAVALARGAVRRYLRGFRARGPGSRSG